MSKKGHDNKVDMNATEKAFLVGYQNKYPQAPIERNTKKLTIGTSKFGDEITYLADFLISGFVFVEVKPFGTREEEFGKLKRRLVKDYFSNVTVISFVEYRPLGKEFFEYEHGLFEKNKIKKIKYGLGRRDKGPLDTKNYASADKKLKFWEEKLGLAK